MVLQSTSTHAVCGSTTPTVVAHLRTADHSLPGSCTSARAAASARCDTANRKGTPMSHAESARRGTRLRPTQTATSSVPPTATSPTKCPSQAWSRPALGLGRHHRRRLPPTRAPDHQLQTPLHTRSHESEAQATVMVGKTPSPSRPLPPAVVAPPPPPPPVGSSPSKWHQNAAHSACILGTPLQ